MLLQFRPLQHRWKPTAASNGSIRQGLEPNRLHQDPPSGGHGHEDMNSTRFFGCGTHLRFVGAANSAATCRVHKHLITALSSPEAVLTYLSSAEIEEERAKGIRPLTYLARPAARVWFSYLAVIGKGHPQGNRAY